MFVHMYLNQLLSGIKQCRTVIIKLRETNETSPMITQAFCEGILIDHGIGIKNAAEHKQSHGAEETEAG